MHYSDLCSGCLKKLRCGDCGHALHAHDEGPCAVNHHEGAEGSECECQGYISHENWIVLQAALIAMRALTNYELQRLINLFPEESHVENI